MTDTDRIAEWLSRLGALALSATPGPWVAHEASDDTGFTVATTGLWQVEGMVRNPAADRADAELIAEARTAVPALAVALRAVLEIHNPITVRNASGRHEWVECAECDDCWPCWPCPTVAAIASAVGETGGAQ